VSTLELEGEELLVFSFLPDLDHPRMATLTKAEREITTLLVAGLSNADIASLRGTTLRTVTKQVEAVYRKMRVTSRNELAAQFER
jgi:DNA-binding NarL/FixJ family response regulator